MKSIYVLLFLTCTIKSYSQTNDFSIDFKYLNPSIVFSEVEIHIKKTDKYITVFAKSGDRGVRRYSISNEEFEKLKSKILSIRPQDVISKKLNEGNILDGGTTEIEFGEDEYFRKFSVKYSVYGLSTYDEKTSRKDFLNTVKIILELAKLKLEDLE